MGHSYEAQTFASFGDHLVVRKPDGKPLNEDHNPYIDLGWWSTLRALNAILPPWISNTETANPYKNGMQTPLLPGWPLSLLYDTL